MMKYNESIRASAEASRDSLADRLETIGALTTWAEERGAKLERIDFLPHSTRELLAIINGSETEKNNFVVAAYRLKGKVVPYVFVKEVDERDPKWAAANDARPE